MDVTPKSCCSWSDAANSAISMFSNSPNSKILSAAVKPAEAAPPASNVGPQDLWIQQTLHFEDPSYEIDSLGISSSIVHSQSIAVGRRKCDDEGDMKKAAETVVNATPGEDLLRYVGSKKFGTILCDPPWQFQNRTGKGCART